MTQSPHDLDQQIAQLKEQLAVHRAELARLKQQIQQGARTNYLAEKQFAESLAEKDRLNELLASAIQELSRRLRNLLSSRLLHLGWFFGLGKTPYWNDPAADELTDLIDLTRPAEKQNPGSLLRKLQASFEHAIPADGGDMQTALRHLYQKGFRPRVVLDVGAAKGYWTRNAADLWRQAEFFMIDPLLESEAELQRLCLDPRFHALHLAVGDQPGETVMQVAAEPDSSSLLLNENPDPASQQPVSIRTIDQLLTDGKIEMPQLVKIDVQGYELSVLRGASKLFEHVEVFIIEANLFQFMPGCPRLHELIQFMAYRGFYPFDFAGFLRRPYENDLGQVDVVFVNQHSPMVASNRWLNESPIVTDPVSHALEQELVISVIICTKDPQPNTFDRVLNALDQQTLGKERFEVVVVDSASRLQLEERQLSDGRSMRIKLIREAAPGLSRARCAGIAHASGELLVFVDDDNFLAADYLEKSLAIARRETRIGLFGGIAEAELEKPIPAWKQPVLAHLGIRNDGDEPITRFADRWGKWEPIGAGMVARRAVAERFVRMYTEVPKARLLGRSGSTLLSGEDSLFARAAFREGFACSYQPSLKLTHFINASRLTARYMSRVVEGHGRSYVLLQRALGKPVENLKLRTAMARMLYRLKDVGRAGFITGRWEIGYAKECRSPSQEIRSDTKVVLSLPPATIAMSVILCTRNPRPDLLKQTLQSLEKQTDESFEIVIVDNGSTPPVQLPAICDRPSRSVSVISAPARSYFCEACRHTCSQGRTDFVRRRR